MKNIRILVVILLIFSSQSNLFSMTGTEELNLKLYEAVKEGNYSSVVDAIIDGADVNSRRGNRTILMRAIDNSHINMEIIKLLVDSGADVNAFSRGYYGKKGSSVLMHAVSKSSVLNFNRDIDITLEIISFLVDRGANIDHVTEDGGTVLNLAASVNFKLIIPEIISDFNVNLFNLNSGMTPLMLTVSNFLFVSSEYDDSHFLSTIKLLLDSGASDSINLYHRFGKTALMESLKNPRIVELLLSFGADINLIDCIGQTELMRELNSINYSRERARLLIENGTNINHVDNSGMTALMYAKKYTQNQEIIESLINAGATE